MPITALTMLFTIGIIMSSQPIPLVALVYGTGIGAFGVGIIQVALSFVRKNLGAFGEPGDNEEAPEPPAS